MDTINVKERAIKLKKDIETLLLDYYKETNQEIEALEAWVVRDGDSLNGTRKPLYYPVQFVIKY